MVSAMAITGTDYNVPMTRTAVVLMLGLFPVAALAQTPPPGNPYDPARYPNPIITFVEDKDFKEADYAAVQKDAGIEILTTPGSEAATAVPCGMIHKTVPAGGTSRLTLSLSNL